MDCFGDVQKLPTFFHNSFEPFNRRYHNQAYNHNEILVTESPNLVAKYDITEHIRPVKSWSFPELNKLSVPMILYRDEDKDYFVGIHSCNTLIIWALNEENELAQVFRKRFKTRIIDIWTFPSIQEPLIIFENGFAEFLDDCKQSFYLEVPIIQSDEKIIGVHGRSAFKNQVILYYVVENVAENMQKSVYKYLVMANKKEIPNNISSKKLAFNEPIQTWAYFEQKNCLVGATRVAEEVVNFFSLEPLVENSKKLKLLFKLEQSLCEKLGSIVFQSKTVCLMSEKSSEDPGYVLEIYELDYFTKIGLMHFNDIVLMNDFCSFNERLIITCKTNIYLVSIRNRKMSLAQLLTKNLAADETNSQINEENIKKFLNIDFDFSMGKNLDKLSHQLKELVKKRAIFPEEYIVFFYDLCTRNYLQSKKNNNQKMENSWQKLFYTVVQLPHNEVFLISCLKTMKSLTFEQCLIGIELLILELPSQQCNVITWITALIDANFNEFLIKPSSKALQTLENLHNRLCSSIGFYQKLDSLKTTIETILNQENQFLSVLANDAPKNIGQYSIEWMTFR